MVTEEDLVRTVTTAYANGWRQVKLYFMCGLPTETDEDVLEIAELANEVIRAGRAATGTRDVRCTVSIGGFVPKPHTPFQWAAQADHETVDRRLRAAARRRSTPTGSSAGPSASATTTASPHRRGPAVPRRPPGRRGDRAGLGATAAASTAGASTSPTTAGWRAAAGWPAVDVDWYTTRERDETEVLPWDHLDSGLDKEWLWQDWQDALDERRARRLPLDPLLRLRRLPDDGHRHPDRPDRQDAAAAAVRTVGARRSCLSRAVVCGIVRGSPSEPPATCTGTRSRSPCLARPGVVPGHTLVAPVRHVEAVVGDSRPRLPRPACAGCSEVGLAVLRSRAECSGCPC